MAEVKPIKVTIDVTGFDAVKEAIARREAKIDSLKEFIREKFCGPCNQFVCLTDCRQCPVSDQLQWDPDAD